METKMHNSWKRGVAIVGGIAIASIVAGGVAVNASSTDLDLERLNEAISANDSIPSFVDLDSIGSNGIVDSSTRLLADSESAAYWAALDSGNNVCIVALIKGDDWVAGSGCSEARSFRQHGVNVRMSNPSMIVEAYLIPDDMLEQAPEVDGEWLHVNGNLMIVDPLMSGSARAQVERTFNAAGHQWRMFPSPASSVGVGE